MGRTARVLMMVIGLVLAVASLTALWFAMRSVMGVGGTCAEGGPYEIQTPCPTGVIDVLWLAIVLGLVGMGLYIVGNRTLPGPDLTLLAWPALFISLGYNFLEAAWQAREGGGDAVIGLVLGGVFVLMGLAPLVTLRTAQRRHEVFIDHSTRSTTGRTAAPDNPQEALEALRQATADDHLTAEEVARLRGMLEPDPAGVVSEPTAAATGSLAMALLQVAAIIAGLLLGIWVSTSMLA